MRRFFPILISAACLAVAVPIVLVRAQDGLGPPTSASSGMPVPLPKPLAPAPDGVPLAAPPGDRDEWKSDEARPIACVPESSERLTCRVHRQSGAEFADATRYRRAESPASTHPGGAARGTPSGAGASGFGSGTGMPLEAEVGDRARPAPARGRSAPPPRGTQPKSGWEKSGAFSKS